MFDDLQQATTYVAELWAFGRDGSPGPRKTLIVNTGKHRTFHALT